MEDAKTVQKTMGTSFEGLTYFNKSRMRQPDRNSSVYELSISRAPDLRCVNSTVKSCMSCEACTLGAKLNQTKEWFVRCGDPAKRRFILGLIHRFESLDLFMYINFILKPLQYKDFTYTRSRSKPSLGMDSASPPTNHALNENKLEEAIDDTWLWFLESAYWTKLNFMLGIMQCCDSPLLFVMANKSRTMYQRERRRQKAIEEGLIEEDKHEYMSLCSTMTRSELSIMNESRRNSEMEAFRDTPTIESKSCASIHSVTTDKTDMSDRHISCQEDEKNKDTLSRPSSRKFRDTPGSATRSVPCIGNNLHSNHESRKIHSAPADSRNIQLKTQQKLMSTFDKDIFSEDYASEDDLEEDELLKTDHSVFVIAMPSIAHSGIAKYKDFIRCLPVHLSKFILGLLDKNSLTNCLCISKHWRILAEEVKADYMVHQLMTEEIMLMQGASAQGMNPRYAKCIPVHVPLNQDLSVETVSLDLKTKSISGRNLAECYDGTRTKTVEMEERNIYCGAYNVLVLQDIEDHHRCTNFSGGKFVVSGSYDRRVRLIDSATGRCERVIQGHAGSIRCVLASEERGIVLSGGYDTSIRSWDIRRGTCKCIFRGHRATVTCISLHGNNLASGSRDKSVKVWNFQSGKCRRTFRHRHVVLDVQDHTSRHRVLNRRMAARSIYGYAGDFGPDTAIRDLQLIRKLGKSRKGEVSDKLAVSGCEGGKLKVWDINSASLVKSLDGHQNAITCVRFDDYHIITGSMDGYAMAWNTIGRHKKCLQAFRHPKEVLCMEFLYCRVITGSADGKLRIWNLLNGDCLRLIRGNSKNDAITTICAKDNRMVINTLSNLLIFNFESVEWDYNLPPERPEGLGRLNLYNKHGPRKLSRHYVRAQRLKRADTKDSLPSRPPSCTAIGGTIEDPARRVASAPIRLAHRTSTLNSINNHVTRITSAHARKTKVIRPHSSPAKVTSSKGADNNVVPFTADHSLKDNAFFTDVLQTYPRPPPLPDNRSAHIISRGRSAPVFRTQTLPQNMRGWSTSAEEAIKPCENKIMVSPSQARMKVAKQRPKSAQEGTKVSISTNPLKNLSCLNLKTYSNQVQYEEDLKKKTKKTHKTKNVTHEIRARSADQPHRPGSFVASFA